MSKYKDLENREKRIERIEKVMKDFKPTEDVIQKIIALNDGLYERFKMCFEDLLETKRLVDEDIKSGRIKVSGYTIYPKYFFGYDKGGISTADEETLELLSDYTEPMYPSLDLDNKSEDVDFEKDFLVDDLSLSWNIENLNLPRLENHHIYMFMHHIFQDADTFCPADIPYLEPKDLQWQIVVEYEYFDK